MKKRRLTLGTLSCLIVVFFALTAATDACGNAIVSSPTNTQSASSGANIDCDKDADGNPIQYKRACQMIKRRYEFMNDANAYGYFYGFVQGSPNPVIEYVVQGGVFPVDDRVNPNSYQKTCIGGGSGACNVVLEKQQPDGTYGSNGLSTFGWTASGNYFEWDGSYAFAQQPLSFTGQKIEGCKAGVPGCP